MTAPSRSQPSSESLLTPEDRADLDGVLIAHLKARITELEGALVPFAAIARELSDSLEEGDKNNMLWAIPTVGNLRAALAALISTRGEK